MNRFRVSAAFAALPFAALWVCGALAGCKDSAPAQPAAGAGAQAMPVAVQPVALSGVPATDTYVATIKGRRSATLQPQVDGNLTKILVKSGDVVKAGQLLMQIDPLKQTATVESQQASEAQQKAMYDYSQTDLARQEQLYKDGIISKQAYDQAVQSFQNSKAGLAAATALTNTQRQQLAYYQIRAPFDGIVGDIPAHVGDYVSTSTVLTTVDEYKDLEAYIYIPTDRTASVRDGLAVDLMDEAGNVLAKSAVDFVSPQVDNNLQGILAKAPVPQSFKGQPSEKLRNGQIVNARITWGTTQQPTVPILAVTRVGGQDFVYVVAPGQKGGDVAHMASVALGAPVGNVYPVQGGLRPGDKVIVSGIQMLQEGAPVKPLEGGPPPKTAS